MSPVYDDVLRSFDVVSASTPTTPAPTANAPVATHPATIHGKRSLRGGGRASGVAGAWGGGVAVAEDAGADACTSSTTTVPPFGTTTSRTAIAAPSFVARSS